jgi:hypothetical protein
MILLGALLVMPGLVPGIHVFLRLKAWMAGTSPAITGVIQWL